MVFFSNESRHRRRSWGEIAETNKCYRHPREFSDPVSTTRFLSDETFNFVTKLVKSGEESFKKSPWKIQVKNAYTKLIPAVQVAYTGLTIRIGAQLLRPMLKFHTQAITSQWLKIDLWSINQSINVRLIRGMSKRRPTHVWHTIE